MWSLSLGYNPSTIFMLTFTVGAALSGLAGGVMAPLTGLLPSIGGAYIAKAFITVITGGAAVIAGTLSTAGAIRHRRSIGVVCVDAGARRNRHAGARPRALAADAARRDRAVFP